MKRRVLVVDDERRFPLLEHDYDVHYAATSEWAFALLDDFVCDFGGIDELWLDHDLGGSDTTMSLVNQLEEMAHQGFPYPVDLIVIHTANPVAAPKMAQALSPYYNVRRLSMAELAEISTVSS